MKLILVRHGHDMPGPNGDSCLSWQGKQQARDAAQRIRDAGVERIDVARFSPSRRATETFDEIATLIPIADSNTTTDLQPGSSVESLESLIWHCWSDEPVTFLCVGHEPQLSNAVLRWCGLPDNEESAGDRPPWILARGEGLLLRPQFERDLVRLDSEYMQFLGRTRPLPALTPRTRAGVF
jgi:phosphohistidine phosphatase SixA